MNKLIIASLALLPSLAFAQQEARPEVDYTPEQVAACNPSLRVASDSDARTSHVGEPVTATATSVITAEEGKMLDWRKGSYAATVGGTHVNRPGNPRATRRVNGFMVVEVTFTSQSHRGRSLRSGRHAEVHNSLAVYQVNASAACAEALGLFSF